MEDISVDSTLSLEELESLIKENKYEEAEKKKECEIYNSVKKIYLKIKKYLNEEWDNLIILFLIFTHIKAPLFST